MSVMSFFIATIKLIVYLADGRSMMTYFFSDVIENQRIQTSHHPATIRLIFKLGFCL